LTYSLSCAIIALNNVCFCLPFLKKGYGSRKGTKQNYQEAVFKKRDSVALFSGIRFGENFGLLDEIIFL